MSRYTKKLPNGKILAWGYDSPLSEYFIQLLKSEEEIIDQNIENPDKDLSEVDFAISNKHSLWPLPEDPVTKLHYSNGEILEVMDKYKEFIPAKHRAAVVMDLPY